MSREESKNVQRERYNKKTKMGERENEFVLLRSVWGRGRMLFLWS